MKDRDKENIKVIGWGALHAVLATLYVLLVTTFISSIQDNQDPQGPLGLTGFLLLFCLSAAIMGSLVFGRPILWYLDGKKKQAVVLLVWTIFFLFAITFSFLMLSLAFGPLAF